MESTCKPQTSPSDLQNEAGTYTAHTQTGVLLNANENPNGLPEVIVQEVIQALPNLALNRYPEDESRALREAYGSWLGVDPSMILAGNGSDQMLQLLIGALGGHGKTLVTLAPDFGMYDFYAASYGTHVLKYPMDLMHGVDVDDFAAYIQEVQPDLVLFSNPNNPTGTMVPAAGIKALADAIAPIALIADEAYMEFGQDSALPYLDSTPNLYITRTLSKAFGLAGLRVGFLISCPENIAALQPHKIVYNLNTLSQTIAALALAHADLYEQQVEELLQERDRMKQEMEAMGLVCGPANANYLCVWPADPAAFQQAFEEAGIQIRSYGDAPYCRITIGLPQQNDQVLSILESLRPSGCPGQKPDWKGEGSDES